MNKEARRERTAGYEKKFYSLIDNEGKPIVTVCLMHNEAKTKFGRGTSICSPDQNPIKNDGMNRAKGRAVKALCNKETTGVIRREEALTQLSNVRGFKHGSRVLKDRAFKNGNRKALTECKSVYFDSPKGLTHDEIELLGFGVAA